MGRGVYGYAVAVPQGAELLKRLGLFNGGLGQQRKLLEKAHAVGIDADVAQRCGLLAQGRDAVIGTIGVVIVDVAQLRAVDEFYCRVDLAQGRQRDDDTMAFWGRQKIESPARASVSRMASVVNSKYVKDISALALSTRAKAAIKSAASTF